MEAAPTPAPPQPPRSATAEAFLDAAERVLVEVGHAGISTRRLAAEAGANQGLVHYYFGSIDELFGQGYPLERLGGIEEGHAELLAWIERWLESLEERKSA